MMYTEIDQEFISREGRWIGAKVGLFSTAKEFTNNGGYSDIDWFRIE